MNRVELLKLLGERRAFASVVEVGVKLGEFSCRFKRLLRANRVVLVDPWKHYGDYADVNNPPQAEQDKRYEFVRKFIPYAEICREESVTAALRFATAGDRFDFVYLDARHDYEPVRPGIAAWWPLIAPGGVLAGHDYLDGKVRECEFGVKRAVQEFAAEFHLMIGVTGEIDYPSWWVWKPRAR